MATIKELRKFMGLTQKELSEKAGINIRLLQKYEGGEYDMENMTSKTIDALSAAFGCRLEQIHELNLSIFTKGTEISVRSGDLSVSNLIAMSKTSAIKKHSKIGDCEATFYANLQRIPDNLFIKLSPEELAALVDAFYKCYGDGKNAPL